MDRGVNVTDGRSRTARPVGTKAGERGPFDPQ